jgi:hypothetical protein
MSANPQPEPESQFIRCLECEKDDLWVMTTSHLRTTGHNSRNLEQYQGNHPGAAICGSLFLKAQSRAHGARVGKSRRNVRFQGRYPVDDWTVVRLIADGYTFVEIGKQTNRRATAIFYTAHRLGKEPHRSPIAPHDLGEPFDTSALRSLKQISGLSTPELADQLNIPYEQFRCRLQTTKKRGLTRQIARTALAWRTEIIKFLLSSPQKRLAPHVGRPANYGPGSVFLSEA